jgi:cell division protein FtsW
MKADALSRMTRRDGAAPRRAKDPDPGWDLMLLVTVLTLVGLGLVMLYSASSVIAAQRMGEHHALLMGQSQKVVLGVFGMLVALQIDYRWYKRLVYPILGVTIVLLVLVTIPGIGVVQNGARRWINVLGFGFQPAEVAKLAAVIFLAYSISKKGKHMGSFSIGFLPHLLIVGLLVGLLMLQPDFGTSVMLIGVMMLLLFVSGAKLSYLLLLTLGGSIMGFLAITSSEYRTQRIMAFQDPWSHRQDIGYQISESLIAIGSAGLKGQGLGQGSGKLGYVPELWNDFIGTIIAEELGIVGIVLVTGLFLVLLWRGFKIAFGASDAFGLYLALGITMLFALQAVMNLFVVTGMLPTKGLTLPFVSFGGTSVIVGLFSIGVLLNISRNEPDRWGQERAAREARKQEKRWERKRQRILRRRDDLRTDGSNLL